MGATNTPDQAIQSADRAAELYRSFSGCLQGWRKGGREGPEQAKYKDMPSCETSIKEIPVNSTKRKYPQDCSQCPAFTQLHLKGADWCCGSQQPSVAKVTLWALLSSELMKSPLPPSVQELRRYYRSLTSQDMAIMDS